MFEVRVVYRCATLLADGGAGAVDRLTFAALAARYDLTRPTALASAATTAPIPAGHSVTSLSRRCVGTPTSVCLCPLTYRIVAHSVRRCWRAIKIAPTTTGAPLQLLLRPYGALWCAATKKAHATVDGCMSLILPILQPGSCLVRRSGCLGGTRGLGCARCAGSLGSTRGAWRSRCTGAHTHRSLILFFILGKIGLAEGAFLHDDAAHYHEFLSAFRTNWVRHLDACWSEAHIDFLSLLSAKVGELDRKSNLCLSL
jgi:hypothetical protein